MNASRCLGLGAALALLSVAGPALANDRPEGRDSAACRRSCNAVHAERLRNLRPVQACLVRCRAGEQHLAKEAGPRPSQSAQPRAVPAPVPPQATPVQPGPVLVVYAGQAPSRAVAISAAGLARDNAHRAAEAACFAGNRGRPCNLLGETAERCVAVAEGRRQLGIIATNHDSTGVVLHHSLGIGGDPRRAEFDALSACGTRTIGQVTGCRVVAQRCR